MGTYLNPGDGLFKIALNSQIFVDKSRLLEVTNRCVGTMQRFVCVSRPRRFGKSMAADMLAAYYLSLIHISEPTRLLHTSRMPSSA